MGEEIKKDEIDRSHRLGAPKTMVKADQSLESLQDTTSDVEFSNRQKKTEWKKDKFSRKFDKKANGSP